MEYAGSYALFNYRLEDPSRGLEYDNLRLIRAFELGLDPTSSEAGFVLVHIAMVRHSGELVSGAVDSLNGTLEDDRTLFDRGMQQVIIALEKINATMNSKSLLSPRYDYVYSSCVSNVEEEQSNRVHKLPNLHLRHRQSKHVPQRGDLRGRL